MARPHPFGGVAARSEIAKIPLLKPPRARTPRAPAMALARPRSELNHIRPKQHKCVAHSRTSLGAHARPCVRTMAVARPRPITWSSRTNYCKMSRRRQTAIDEATSSRGRPSRNSNRARQDTFPNERFDHQLHFDRWKGMENRGIVHERIVWVDGEEWSIFRNRIQELGWGFMFGHLVRINLSMVREFCANFFSASQNHVYLRGKKIPFTEAHIRSYLGIPGDAPDADIDDAFITLAKAYKKGEDVNMGVIYAEIGRPETNWVDNPANNTIPSKINNSVLNAKATAWHKIIMVNIDPKTHGTKFDLKHAFLIYVLMTDGDVNLPRLMRDILLVRPTKHPNHLLPFPVFIMRMANRHEVPEFPDDKFYVIRPVDTYVPYGDWRGERARAPARQRRQPPPHDHPADQFPQPETSAAPSTSAQSTMNRSYQQIMRHLERQEHLLRRQGRQIANTQLMIRQAFPDAVFEGLVSDDSGGSTEAES
ncbi:hypothetical protein PIB30_009642 [Stylosanthes scabra]|uniref:Putative plant transposon protein domain-containing protein n=1 Tax=Stylosanthes scabra TaxID=79078 RepID=A0ABU6T6N6_9FABA|nr:hypothetical protein [Stylosanthes scabra]